VSLFDAFDRDPDRVSKFDGKRRPIRGSEIVEVNLPAAAVRMTEQLRALGDMEPVRVGERIALTPSAASSLEAHGVAYRKGYAVESIVENEAPVALPEPTGWQRSKRKGRA
jgi:hypothetical protein